MLASEATGSNFSHGAREICCTKALDWIIKTNFKREHAMRKQQVENEESASGTAGDEFSKFLVRFQGNATIDEKFL